MEFIVGSYNYYLVGLSVGIATLASFVAFDLIGLTWEEKQKGNYQSWLVMSSVVMGVGIWTMHFVGMFAYQLPFLVQYEAIQTVISLLMAVLGSYLAFQMVLFRHNTLYLIFAAVMLGASIIAMHYTGMAAMHIQASMHYNFSVVLLSILVAIAVSWLALRLFFDLAANKITILFSVRILMASVMGVAISSTHYIGMAAIHFTHNYNPLSKTQGIFIQGNNVLTMIMFSAVLLIITAIYISKIKLAVSTKLEKELGLMRMSERQLRLIIENAHDAFFVHDLDGNIIDANKAAYENLGYSREELLGATIFDFEVGANLKELKTKIWSSLENGSSNMIRGSHMRKDGNEVPVEVSLTGFKEGDKNMVSAFAHDVTETELFQVYLEKLAMIDELTGINNRRAFMNTLEQEISRTRRNKSKMSLLMVDIDYFKKINDEYGHSAGDRALQHFVTLAKNTIRNEDHIGRIGGEEFAILLPDTDIKETYVLSDRLKHVIADSVFEDDERKIKFTISIGIASYTDKKMDSNQFLKNADIAMYQAKENGRNRVEIFGA